MINEEFQNGIHVVSFIPKDRHITKNMILWRASNHKQVNVIVKTTMDRNLKSHLTFFFNFIFPHSAGCMSRNEISLEELNISSSLIFSPRCTSMWMSWSTLCVRDKRWGNWGNKRLFYRETLNMIQSWWNLRDSNGWWNIMSRYRDLMGNCYESTGHGHIENIKHGNMIKSTIHKYTYNSIKTAIRVQLCWSLGHKHNYKYALRWKANNEKNEISNEDCYDMVKQKV